MNHNIYFYLLIKAGKLKSYEFGRLFRQRYAKFLPVTCNSSFINVQSTDTDRTEMTASTFLAGAFPPVGIQIWNKELQWIPTPIRSIPANQDNVHFQYKNRK